MVVKRNTYNGNGLPDIPVIETIEPALYGTTTGYNCTLLGMFDTKVPRSFDSPLSSLQYVSVLLSKSTTQVITSLEPKRAPALFLDASLSFNSMANEDLLRPRSVSLAE